MAAAPHRHLDERLNLDPQAGHHPGRVRRNLGEQGQVGIKGPIRRREAEGNVIREHQAVDRYRRTGIGPVQRGAEAHEAGFVDRIRGRHAVLLRQRQPVTHV